MSSTTRPVPPPSLAAATLRPTGEPTALQRDFGRIVGDHANLKIHEFAVHRRTLMATHGRSLPCYIMSYVKEGGSILRAGGRDHVVREGEVLIVPPRLVHDHVMTKPGRAVFLWWHFDLTIGQDLDVLRFLREPTVFPIDNRDHFEAQFLLYAELEQRPSSTLATHLLRRAKSLELLSYLLEGAAILKFVADRFGDVPDQVVAMLRDVVDDPATFRHVAALAERHGVTPAQVTSRFRHFFGATPSRIGRGLLYEKALLLIRSRDLSLEDVAFELGFSEPSSFTRFFKSVEGLSPSALRRGGPTSAA